MLPMWAGAALRECLRLHRHNDDNVMSIMGLALDKERFHMIYPYMQNRTLKDHIVDTKKVGKRESPFPSPRLNLSISQLPREIHGKVLVLNHLQFL